MIDGLKKKQGRTSWIHKAANSGCPDPNGSDTVGIKLDEHGWCSVDDFIAIAEEILGFYPVHIEKEDKHFYIPCMKLFNPDEQAEMLREFDDFDKNLIHERYKARIEELKIHKTGFFTGVVGRFSQLPF